MLRILIIDDEQPVRESLGEALAAVGHEVCLAANGVRGLQEHAKFRPDLVITDIIMPDMEGIGTISELRRRDPALPIIAMSGSTSYGGVNYLKAARDLGANRTLTKPIRPAEMLEAIHDLVPQTA
jgi:CheY-like chemotaxis protein